MEEMRGKRRDILVGVVWKLRLRICERVGGSRFAALREVCIILVDFRMIWKKGWWVMRLNL